MSTMEQEKKMAYTNCEQGLQLFMGSGSPLGEEQGISTGDFLGMSGQESNMKLPLHLGEGRPHPQKPAPHLTCRFSHIHHDSK
jgi:hypothetical protein